MIYLTKHRWIFSIMIIKSSLYHYCVVDMSLLCHWYMTNILSLLKNNHFRKLNVYLYLFSQKIIILFSHVFDAFFILLASIRVIRGGELEHWTSSAWMNIMWLMFKPSLLYGILKKVGWKILLETCASFRKHFKKYKKFFWFFTLHMVKNSFKGTFNYINWISLNSMFIMGVNKLK